MNWLGYTVLGLLWTCCAFQRAPAFHQGQGAYQEIVHPVVYPEIARNCGPPPAIDNAMLFAFQNQDFSPGSKVLYQCYRLFEMEGTPLARCLNGQWRGVPKCVETCRADESDMERNNIQLRSITKSTSMRSSDYWMEFECKRGFQKAPSSPPFRKQCLKGLWLYPRCI